MQTGAVGSRSKSNHKPHRSKISIHESVK